MSIADPMDADQLELTRAVLTAMNESEVPYVLGGAIAVNRHGGPWRNTKDLDLFVPPADRERVIDTLLRLGFVDYYAVWPYDREWIFRGHKGNKIVDVIWQSANKIGVVDPSWRERAAPGELAGVPTWFASAEDLIWLKAFIVQRERCDWPDILNLLVATQGQLDWGWLLERFGPHRLLLGAVVKLFDWTCPQHAGYVPAAIRRALQQREEQHLPVGPATHSPAQAAGNGDHPDGSRWQLLDSRPWFVEAGENEG
jgi:hypothetical protein